MPLPRVHTRSEHFHSARRAFSHGDVPCAHSRALALLAADRPSCMLSYNMKRHGNYAGSAKSPELSPLTAPPVSSPPRHSREGLPAESEWWHSAFIVMAEVMGMGVLGLPHAMAHVGWALGLFSSVFFGLAALYSALLLSRVKNEMFGPAESYGDVALMTFGPAFGAFTRTVFSAFPLLPGPRRSFRTFLTLKYGHNA